MNPEETQRHNEIVKLNHQTRLFENLKAHLTGLFSQAANSLKNNLFRVEVQNPTTTVSVDNLIDTREDIKNSAEAIVRAVRAIPESKEVDLSEVKKSLNKIIELLTPPPLPKEVKAESPPKFLSEELIYNDEDELIKVIHHWDKFDRIEERKEKTVAGRKTYTWTEKEVKK